MERFWSKVNKLLDNECWNWLGAIDTPGYGAFKLGKNKVNSHRVAFALSKNIELEEIPKGYEVCHTCDNRLCCNPNHLFLGTRSDNMKDCANKGRLSFQTLEARKKQSIKVSKKARAISPSGEILEANSLKTLCELISSKYNIDFQCNTVRTMLKRKKSNKTKGFIIEYIQSPSLYLYNEDK